MKSMEKDLNARLLSRIGFVTQDMKDIEYEVYYAIQDRAIEINDLNAECLWDARRNLQESVDNAGDAIMNVATTMSEDINMINADFVYPTLDEIELLISQFDVEIFLIFSQFNSVLSMFQIILTMESEIRFYGALFEYYVTYIYVDMIIFNMLADNLVAASFPQLQAGLNVFRNSGNAIRSSLADCN